MLVARAICLPPSLPPEENSAKRNMFAGIFALMVAVCTHACGPEGWDEVGMQEVTRGSRIVQMSPRETSLFD